MFKNLKSCLVNKLKQALNIYELEDKNALLTRNNEALNKDIKILYGKINAMVNNLDASTVNLVSAINDSFAKGCSIEVSKKDGIVSYGFLYNAPKEVVEEKVEVEKIIEQKVEETVEDVVEEAVEIVKAKKKADKKVNKAKKK